jgi:hypothetical protein
MTLEDLFQSLAVMSKEDRVKQNLVLFDYSTNSFIKLPELEVCTEGMPPWHLTINGDNF